MRFRITVSCAIDADTAEEALYLYRDAHSAVEDALVDHFGEHLPHPNPEFERFNLCCGRIEGLDSESRQALASVPEEDED